MSEQETEVKPSVVAEIKIDKGIPIPESAIKRKYPFAEMEVGDSFFCPGETAGKAATVFSRTSEAKFSSRRVIENNVKGQRVWRVE